MNKFQGQEDSFKSGSIGFRGRKRRFEKEEKPFDQTFVRNEPNASPPWRRNESQNQDAKRHRFENPKPGKSESESKFQESTVYYEKVLCTLKQGIDIEFKDIFSTNVLEQSQGQEVELSCHGTSSHCIELLLSDCNNPAVFTCFMNAFSENKLEVCTNANASHITETLIYFALQSMENWSSVIQSNEDTEKGKLVTDFITWLHSFGQFYLENLNVCLGNTYACHVLSTLIQALGGHYSDEKSFVSKNSRKHKANFHEQYLGEEHCAKTKSPISIDEIPKFFIDILKKLTKSVMKLQNLTDYVMESSTATVIQALLFVLKRTIPKYCKKLVNAIASKVFLRKNNDGVPMALLHKNSSYVVEKMFQAAEEEQQEELWLQYFANCLEHLVVHPVSNFIIQRLFDVVASKTQFEIMSQAAGNLFDMILESRHYGVFLSIATACNRLKAQQVQFMKNIMQCLHCAESEDSQLCLAPLILGLKKYEEYVIRKESASDTSCVEICLQGSLVLQAVLKFHKPIKAVKSILNMKPEELAFMASHVQGCHVLKCFLESNNVGEKNKDKLIHHIKPVLCSIASDRNGSLTLARMWVLLSLKQKALILNELSYNERTLKDNRDACVILKKFGLFHYTHNNEKWKAIQLNLSNKRVEFPCS